MQAITFKLILSFRFYCTFDFTWYPFDTQKCGIRLVKFDAFKDMLNLHGTNVTFSGNTELLQFQVTEWKIEKGDGDFNELYAKLIFKRRCLNHIATTYVPSLCILLATECMVFFKKEHFKTSIPVTITTMLGK